VRKKEKKDPRRQGGKSGSGDTAKEDRKQYRHSQPEGNIDHTDEEIDEDPPDLFGTRYYP